MRFVTLYHLISGVSVPYRRACEFVKELANGSVVVRIKGAADGHYRDRVVGVSQLGQSELAA